VQRFKGQLPQNKEDQRLQNIKKLNIADVVELGSESDYFFAIKKHKPDIIALGYNRNNIIIDLGTFLFENKYKTEVITIDSLHLDK